MSANGIFEVVDKRSALVIDFVLIDAYFYQGGTLIFLTGHNTLFIVASMRKYMSRQTQELGVVLRRCPMQHRLVLTRLSVYRCSGVHKTCVMINPITSYIVL
jgi:hypothetical protein